MDTKMEKKYSMKDVLAILFKRLWIVLLSIAVASGGAYLVSTYLMQKIYTTSVSMYVASESEPSDVYASLNELTYAQEVVNTYIEILKTNTFLSKVTEASGLEYSSGELSDMIEINAVNKTEIFRVTVKTGAPIDSYILANKIAELAPLKIVEIKGAGIVRVVDKATLPKKPSSPNIMVNTVIGAALGTILGIMLALMLEMMNKRVKDEEDITKHYNVPILGRVPVMKEKRGGRG